MKEITLTSEQIINIIKLRLFELKKDYSDVVKEISDDVIDFPINIYGEDGENGLYYANELRESYHEDLLILDFITDNDMLYDHLSHFSEDILEAHNLSDLLEELK